MSGKAVQTSMTRVEKNCFRQFNVHLAGQSFMPRPYASFTFLALHAETSVMTS